MAWAWLTAPKASGCWWILCTSYPGGRKNNMILVGKERCGYISMWQ